MNMQLEFLLINKVMSIFQQSSPESKQMCPLFETLVVLNESFKDAMQPYHA